MKIKVKDIRPNPYRRTDVYPTDKEHVRELADSIEKNGFWDNLVAREKDGEVQIAYGHHRIEALKIAEGYGEDFEFELTIKNIDERTMITIMADENISSRMNSISAIDETIMVARDYLMANPEEAAKWADTDELEYAKRVAGAGQAVIGKNVLSKFLGWKGAAQTGRVLARLRLMEDGTASKEAMQSLPSQSHADDFGRALREAKDKGVSFSEAEQKELAKEISGDNPSGKVVSSRGVRSLVGKKAMDKKYPKKNISEDTERRRQVDMFEMFLTEVSRKARLLDEDLSKLDDYKDQLTTGDKNRLSRGVGAVLRLVALQKKLIDFTTWIKEGDPEEMVDTETGEITSISYGEVAEFEEVKE